MSENNFKALVQRYANGKALCNCQEAYYTNCGHGSKSINGKWVDFTDLPCCESGCSSNKISAKYYIAEKITEEFLTKKFNG